jgi:hypothetical protein
MSLETDRLETGRPGSPGVVCTIPRAAAEKQISVPWALT